MPDADTVWLAPLPEMLDCLERVGLVVRWQHDCSRSHGAVADSLINAFAADAGGIAGQIGRRALEELLAAHRLWSDWLREGRVRKIAFVAEKTGTAPHDSRRRRASRRTGKRHKSQQGESVPPSSDHAPHAEWSTWPSCDRIESSLTRPRRSAQ